MSCKILRGDLVRIVRQAGASRDDVLSAIIEAVKCADRVAVNASWIDGVVACPAHLVDSQFLGLNPGMIFSELTYDRLMAHHLDLLYAGGVVVEVVDG